MRMVGRLWAGGTSLGPDTGEAERFRETIRSDSSRPSS